jgi:hypothetical protein
MSQQENPYRIITVTVRVGKYKGIKVILSEPMSFFLPDM